MSELSKFGAMAKRWAVRWLLPRMLTVLRVVLPARPHVVLVCTPSIEASALAVGRWILANTDSTIVWLDAPSAAFLRAQGLDSARIHAIDKGTVRALFLYASAALVVFTHGLYGEPRATERKPTLNLWHGEGPKRTDRLFGMRSLRGRPFDYYVGSTALWAPTVVAAAGIASDRIICSGSPRSDELVRRPRAERLAALGVSPDRPFVLWLPAYRRAAASGTMPAFVDADGEADVGTIRELAECLAGALARFEIQFVVKGHPLDADAHSVEGAVIVDDAALESAGVSLYQLLGASCGLVSDYSSVWTDYLWLDRPVGFLWPDFSAYSAGRGVWPEDLRTFLPGVELSSTDVVERFAADVAMGGMGAARLRDGARDRIGPYGASGATERLFAELFSRVPRLRARLRVQSSFARCCGS